MKQLQCGVNRAQFKQENNASSLISATSHYDFLELEQKFDRSDLSDAIVTPHSSVTPFSYTSTVSQPGFCMVGVLWCLFVCRPQKNVARGSASVWPIPGPGPVTNLKSVSCLVATWVDVQRWELWRSGVDLLHMLHVRILHLP